MIYDYYRDKCFKHRLERYRVLWGVLHALVFICIYLSFLYIINRVFQFNSSYADYNMIHEIWLFLYLSLFIFIKMFYDYYISSRENTYNTSNFYEPTWVAFLTIVLSIVVQFGVIILISYAESTRIYNPETKKMDEKEMDVDFLYPVIAFALPFFMYVLYLQCMIIYWNRTDPYYHTWRIKEEQQKHKDGIRAKINNMLNPIITKIASRAVEKDTDDAETISHMLRENAIELENATLQ